MDVPPRRKARARRRNRSAKIDAAASLFDDDRGKAFALRVLGRIAHAEIKGEADEKGPLEIALAQIAGKSGRRRAVPILQGIF